ncbi:MAG TPA: hypothetical protein VFA07_04975 [Chthonomonadaceae bacterium]|nr:hypothetical protein [Chthonomonadaceae bacterium]
MDCPRCRSHVPDTATQCPVCYKPLTGRPATMHVTLNGEVIEGPPAPPPTMPLGWQIPEETPVIPASTPSPSAPLREQIRQDRRWLIVLAALAGMLICFAFLLWPPLSLPPTDRFSLLYLIPDHPPIFFLLSIGYIILAFLTLRLLPAPWYSGFFRRRRNNYVLWATAQLGFSLFVVVVLSQIMNESHGERIARRDSGYSVYQGFTRVRDISDQEAQQLQAEADRRLREKVSRGAAGALLFCYAGIAGYGAWWLLTRPDWRHPMNLAEEIGHRL